MSIVILDFLHWPVCFVMAPLYCAAICLLLLASTGHAFSPSAFKLPPGFKIAVYKDGLPNARSLARSQANRTAEIVYVSTNAANQVALRKL
jgi:hypothetical protein